MSDPHQARGRFAVTVLGAVFGSAALLAVLLTTAPTPQEAKADRAAPVLPVPVMEVGASKTPDVVTVPEGAIMTDGDGQLFVTVRQDGEARRVDVRKQGVGDGGRVLVRADGLEAGDQVELVAVADAALPPEQG